jgi:hypothetical protein
MVFIATSGYLEEHLQSKLALGLSLEPSPRRSAAPAPARTCLDRRSLADPEGPERTMTSAALITKGSIIVLSEMLQLQKLRDFKGAFGSLFAHNH